MAAPGCYSSYMTNAQSPRIVATAETTNRYAIGVLESTHYKTGQPTYSVVRMDPQSRYITLHYAATEQAARDLANEAWKRDKYGAQMIY